MYHPTKSRVIGVLTGIGDTGPSVRRRGLQLHDLASASDDAQPGRLAGRDLAALGIPTKQNTSPDMRQPLGAGDTELPFLSCFCVLSLRVDRSRCVRARPRRQRQRAECDRGRPACRAAGRARLASGATELMQHTRKSSGGRDDPGRHCRFRQLVSLQVTGATSAALTVVLITGRSTPPIFSTTPK